MAQSGGDRSDQRDRQSPAAKTGERFLGTVVKTTDFGAFVSLLPGRDGLVHISKLGKGKRIAKVEDVVKVGDKLRVEIADIDNRGKISLILVDEESADADARPQIRHLSMPRPPAASRQPRLRHGRAPVRMLRLRRNAPSCRAVCGW